MSVNRILQRDVDVIEPTDSARVAANRMQQRTVGSLVVVDRNHVPLGMITDRDLVVRLIAEGRDPDTTMVGQIMTGPVASVEEDAPIESAVRVMRQGAFRRLPVVGKSGRLSGIVSLDDILLLLAEEFRDIGDLVGSETPQAAAVAG